MKNKIKVGELYLIHGHIFVYNGGEFSSIREPFTTWSLNAVNKFAKKATDKDILKELNQMVRSVIINDKLNELHTQFNKSLRELYNNKSEVERDLCDHI